MSKTPGIADRSDVASVALEVSDLCAGYGSWQVLHDISFAAWPGETLGILGHNGAGKTTLLKTIAGLIRPTRGQVALDGQPVTGWTVRRRVRAGLALVPQGRALFSELTVRQNVWLGAFCRPSREVAGAWAQLTADQPLLADRADIPVGRLSGGQQQIVANARGLASAPRVLLVDEPSLGLSGVAVSELAAFITTLKEAGIVTILVEQNVGLAFRVCDRFVLLRSGRIVGSYARDALPREELWALF